MRPAPIIPSDIEDYRDTRWWREPARQVYTPLDAERFIEQVGFAACLTDARRPGPSLFVSVCGRRDAVMPRNVQKDHEASLTWNIKDQLLRRGKVYYAKVARGRAMFIAPRMLPYFHAIWGVRTADLRGDSGVKDRAVFNRALDELQASMLVIPCDVVDQPFTYIWTLGVGRFPDALRRRIGREVAVREIARCFLANAGLTVPGELARVVGLSRPEAGL